MDAQEETVIRLFERNGRVVDKAHHIMQKEILSVLNEILVEMKKMNKPVAKPAGRPKKTE